MPTPSAALVSPVTPFPMKRKIAAILAADIAGYSRLVAEDEERTLTDLAAAREILDGLIVRVGGRIFNTAGDSVMVEFDSAVEALRAAVDVQEAMKARNAGVDARRRLEFRMGLTIGDVVERGGDLLGDGVNIAARLESLAPPGGICVSRSVHEAVSNKLSVSFRELGPRQVKNIPQPVFAYLIEPAGEGSLGSESFVARRSSASSSERPRRRAREPGDQDDRERKKGGFLRPLLTAVAILCLIFIGVPLLKVARTAIGDGQTSAPVGGGEPNGRTEKAPANESASPSAPPPSEGRAAAPDKPSAAAVEKPAAAPPSPASTVTRPQRVERPKPPATPQPTKEATRPDIAARPDPAPKPSEAPRPDRPSDPAVAYAAMAREGLIPDAKSLAELYHNARFLEAKADRTGALAAYGAAAPLAGEYIDVHFRHASLLRASKGAAGVRQVYSGLAKTNPSQAAEIVLALSNEGDDRRASLESLQAVGSDSPIVDHLLADALLDARDGGPTLTDRRLAFDLGERFLDASADGSLNGRFVDRAFLDAWMDAARRRKGDIERFFSSGKTRPAVAFSRVPSGWLAKLSLPEPASAVNVRLGERGTPTSTGSSSETDAKTGKPLPNLEFELPNGTPRSTLYVTYQDRSGRDAGPYPLPFDPGSTTVETGRSALERFPETWVSFREDMPDVLSFAGLISNRCALSKVAIGFGDEPPRRAVPLPPCDPAGAATMPSSGSLISLPDGTDTVRVQLVFADGTESPVRTFKRP